MDYKQIAEQVDNVQKRISSDLYTPTRELTVHCLGYVKLRISYWDEGITWQFTNEQRSTLFDKPPYFGKLPLDDENLLAWQAAIPKEIQSKACKYYDYFAILYFTSHYDVAYQLFVSQPTLFWMLLVEAKEAYWSEQKLLAACLLPRAKIAELCGLPGKAYVLKLLTKLDDSLFTMLDIAIIRQLVKLDEVHKLNHFKTIHIKLARLLLDGHAKLIGSKLLTSLSQCAWPDDFEITLRDTIRLASDLQGQDAAYNRVSLLQSVQQVQQLHDELVVQKTTKDKERLHRRMQQLSFPEQPLADSDNIIAIHNHYELVEEGILQGHCVAAYFEDIINGDYYVYKVMLPERATLGVSLIDGKVSLNQLYLKDNEVVSKETYQTVNAWLSDSLKTHTTEQHGH